MINFLDTFSPPFVSASHILDRVAHSLLLEIISSLASEPEIYLFSSCLSGSSLKIAITSSFFSKHSLRLGLGHFSLLVYILSLSSLIPSNGSVYSRVTVVILTFVRTFFWTPDLYSSIA